MQLAMVAAGFTPGEADQLRRAMAAWKRKGGLEHFEQRLIDGMARARLRARVRRADLPADPGLRRIRLSRIARGELRAAGLRLGVAQVPRARGVPRRAAQQPADGLLRAVAARAGRAPARRRGAAGRRARRATGTARWSRRQRDVQCDAAPVRLGLRMVDGPVAKPAPQRIVAARARAAVRRASKISRSRAQLDRARSRAPRRSRRARGARRPSPRAPRGTSPASRRAAAACSRHAPFARSARRSLPRRPKARTSSPTTARSASRCGRHPLALLRAQLARAAARDRGRDRARRRTAASSRTAGIVIGRQRPDTASGVVFVTLEDETGAST